MRLFLNFILISGVGWLTDLTSYVTITQLFNITPAYANFISSVVGITYVWCVALKQLFDRSDYRKSIYLPIYWIYQSASILAYSALISIVVASATNSNISEMLGAPVGLVAKIMITVPNLFTNFIFIKFLTSRMRDGVWKYPLQ